MQMVRLKWHRRRTHRCWYNVMKRNISIVKSSSHQKFNLFDTLLNKHHSISSTKIFKLLIHSNNSQQFNLRTASLLISTLWHHKADSAHICQTCCCTTKGREWWGLTFYRGWRGKETVKRKEERHKYKRWTGHTNRKKSVTKRKGSGTGNSVGTGKKQNVQGRGEIT